MTRILTAISVLVLGLIITLFGYLTARSWDVDRAKLELENEGIDFGKTLQIQIAQHLTLTKSLHGFFGSSQDVTRDEFNRFGQVLSQNNPNIIGIGWIPRVPMEDRKSYEVKLSEISPSNLGVWEINHSGNAVIAGERAEYFPLFYGTPDKTSLQVLGFDFSSEQYANAAMMTARDTGELSVTPAIQNAIGGQNERRILSFMAFYGLGEIPGSVAERRQKLKGFVVCSHRIDSIFDSSFSTLGKNRINLYLFDNTSSIENKLLHAFGNLNKKKTVSLTDFENSNYSYNQSFVIGDRDWILAAEATPEFIKTWKTNTPVTILLSGLLISLLLTCFIDKILSTSYQSRWLAENEAASRELAEYALSEQHRVEGALRESERKFKAIFNNSFQFIGLLDTDGILLDANSTSLEFLNTQKAEVLNKPFWDAGWWNHSFDIQQQLIDAVSKAARGELVKLLVKHISHGGHEHVFDFSITPLIGDDGNVKLLIPEGRDITHRMEMEKKLENSEKELRMLLDQSPIGMRLSTLSGEIIHANQAFAKILGYSADDVLRLNIHDITPPEFIDSDRAIVAQLKTTGRFSHYEKNYVHQDGHLVPVRVNANIIERNGKKYAWSSIEDISALKASENEAKMLAEKLQQAQKMEAIGTLAGGIAHDFNNLLGIIIGNIELLKRKLDKGLNYEQQIKNIQDANTRAVDLIKQILTFSRQGDQDFVSLNLKHTVMNTIDLLRATIPSTVQIKTNIVEESIFAKADQTQLQQAIINLCTNGVQAMQESGVLSLSLEKIKSIFPQISKISNYCAKLTVQDTGCGMDQDTIKLIFDPFFTTKEIGKGTGMGLSVVHGIVERHGGVIAVDSTPGYGAKFSIYLPLTNFGPETAEIKIGTQTDRGSEHILLVDDEPDIVALNKELLKDYGYQVTGVTSSVEALQLFKNNSAIYDLVVTDQSMPGLSGIELATQIHKARADLPIILCSGYSSKITNSADAYASGIQEFCMKPLTDAQLARVIRKVLDHKESDQKGSL